jgi:hypothetical protein
MEVAWCCHDEVRLTKIDPRAAECQPRSETELECHVPGVVRALPRVLGLLPGRGTTDCAFETALEPRKSPSVSKSLPDISEFLGVKHGTKSAVEGGWSLIVPKPIPRLARGELQGVGDFISDLDESAAIDWNTQTPKPLDCGLQGRQRSLPRAGPTTAGRDMKRGRGHCVAPWLKVRGGCGGD